mgnify:CR=1 FL=1
MLDEEIDKKKDEETLTAVDWIKSIVIALVLALIIRTYVASATTVSGTSMNDTLQDRDVVLINKMVNLDNIERGDIIVFDAPDDKDKDYIKRVIGLPGDKIDIFEGSVYINGEKLSEPYINTDYTYAYDQIANQWIVGEDELFVMGDNRIPGKSSDSRIFGTILKDSLVGRAVFRIYPFSTFGFLK